MANHANWHHLPANVDRGFACLSTEHLRFVPGLSRKLAAKCVGPFRVTDAVGTVSFHLELPS